MSREEGEGSLDMYLTARTQRLSFQTFELFTAFCQRSVQLPHKGQIIVRVIGRFRDFSPGGKTAGGDEAGFCDW